MAMRNWQNMLTDTLRAFGESWDDVEKCTLSKRELLRSFDTGYGGTNGTPFTLWTKNRVYFPVQYDGAEWVGSVPRNPCDEVTEHIGG